MGKDLKGKELGVGICQRKDGLYTARFVSKRTGKSVQRYFPKLQECRKWYADAKFELKEHVFLSRKGEPTKNSAYDTSLFKLFDKADIRRFSMHVLRYTMATRCIEGGMRPKTLQVILGHSNVGITMDRYVYATEDEKFKEVEKIESALKIVQ